MTNGENTIRKVLIVDDDEFLLNMYILKFKNKGMTPIAAKTGREALDKLRSEGEDIDCILLDIIMPDMNGLDVLETIKHEGLDHNKTVIMLTNQGSSEEIGRAQDLGVNGYIVKATSIPSEVVDQVIEIHNK